MGTRSTIAVEHADGTISEVYCHLDGYLSHTGKILVEHYNTLELAQTLVAGGPYRFLSDTPGKENEKLPGGSGDEHYNSFAEYIGQGHEQEYNYLFKDGEWVVCIGDVWSPLAFALTWAGVKHG